MNKIFDNCDSKTNGEINFFNLIKDSIHVIFDIGCRTDSEFLNFKGEVHYFDPVPFFIDNVSKRENQNIRSFFNPFGLGTEASLSWYYPKYQSFLNRIESCKVSDESNRIELEIRRGEDYVLEKKIEHIDFLKIDTEGFELDVLKGFGQTLERVKMIQFEYGGTYIDRKIKLIDVIEYLQGFGFKNFSYLVPNGYVPITDFTDHFRYCNIVCFK